MVYWSKVLVWTGIKSAFESFAVPFFFIIYPTKKKCNTKTFPLNFPLNAQMLIVIKY